MKRSAQKGNILIILVIIAALTAGVVFYLKSNSPTTPTTNYINPPTTSQPTSTKSAEQTKTFQSKTLKFTIILADNFQIEEKPGRVDLLNPNGKAYIDRNTTNFSDINEYLKDLDMHNKVKIIENKQIAINNYSANLRRITLGSGETQKVYTIFIDGWIYSIYSDSDSLYSDLDQIAKSFRYTP